MSVTLVGSPSAVLDLWWTPMVSLFLAASFFSLPASVHCLLVCYGSFCSRPGQFLLQSCPSFVSHGCCGPSDLCFSWVALCCRASPGSQALSWLPWVLCLLWSHQACWKLYVLCILQWCWYAPERCLRVFLLPGSHIGSSALSNLFIFSDITGHLRNCGSKRDIKIEVTPDLSHPSLSPAFATRLWMTLWLPG